MDLLYYLRLARSNWLLILLSMVLAAATALVITAKTPPRYAATVSMLVSAHDKETSTATAYQAALLSAQRVKSYARLLTSRKLVSRVASGEDEIRRLLANVTAEAVPDTVILQATVTDGDPARAARLANALGTAFTRLIDQMERVTPNSPATVKVTVVDQAGVPKKPVSPRPLLNLAIALLIALMVAACAIAVRKVLDTAVTSIEELRRLSNSPVLGVIGYERDARRYPLILRHDGQSSRSEAFRSLRTNLRFVSVDHKPRSLVVTSCLPSEGKTSVATNLAITFAHAGWRVILVDGDLRRPHVPAYLGIEGAVGLTDVLVGDVELPDAVQSWGEPRLSVLPSGKIPPNPSELLGSQEMRKLINGLTADYDIVIIDTAPLLPVTDAAALAATCDDVLLVAKCGKTRRENVTRAGELLSSVNAHLVGAVLNFVPHKSGEVYGYGEYRTDVNEQPAPLVGV
ncbi:polysaccharide biosynthesis tyrosine autokinase [Sphaerisporangium perillae]|uniref:polysaccharide biosynthesis tyrosine autokinase n=1 Tax=Sphaerisporangium perillae TaxID=2935860 RepID=UPI002010230D|nr:polysaccharide biosynthesis tyrosine autokinase [Sphaerisporangium perillae]